MKTFIDTSLVKTSRNLTNLRSAVSIGKQKVKIEDNRPSSVCQRIMLNEFYGGNAGATVNMQAPFVAMNRHGLAPNFVRAHLIADRFGAPCIPENMMSLTPAANVAMNVVENFIAGYAVANPGSIINYNVLPDPAPYAGPLPAPPGMSAGIFLQADDVTAAAPINIVPPLHIAN